MALFNLGFARRHGGQFLLRIEDTDRARFRADSEQQLYDTLHWLGLGWDEGPDIGGPCRPYRQSERLANYRPYVEQLLAQGHAYYCWCTPERLQEMRQTQEKAKRPTGYDRLCHGKSREERATLPGFTETPVVRMLIPDDAPRTFIDVIRGEVKLPHPDDQVILKADGYPTYHLAVVVDDHEMGITHVVRGEEWISSTPKHLLLYRWLGLAEPAFAHMPLLRNDDHSKISKRKNPAARLTWFSDQGYLPEALLNFLALLAYPPIQEADGSEREVFTFEEFSAGFDWSKVSPGGPIFDLKKLDWLNGVYIRSLELADFTERLMPYLLADNAFGPGIDAQDQLTAGQHSTLQAIAPLIQTRIGLLNEASDYVRPFFQSTEDLLIADDARAQLKEGAGDVLAAASTALRTVDDWTRDDIESAIRGSLIETMGLKPKTAFTPIRVATSGARISPPLFESLEILGRDETLDRLTRLIGEL